jgi:hypothetical protein
MVAYLDHLGLVAWPFSIVPRRQYCDFLAGRTQLKDDISTLLRGLSRRDTSSIHILWSWLGAGKTHSLFYLMNRCGAFGENAHVELCPIYSEFPKRARGFFDLYSPRRTRRPSAMHSVGQNQIANMPDCTPPPLHAGRPTRSTTCHLPAPRPSSWGKARGG